jgi:hypothetical protein
VALECSWRWWEWWWATPDGTTRSRHGSAHPRPSTRAPLWQGGPTSTEPVARTRRGSSTSSRHGSARRRGRKRHRGGASVRATSRAAVWPAGGAAPAPRQDNSRVVHRAATPRRCGSSDLHPSSADSMSTASGSLSTLGEGTGPINSMGASRDANANRRLSSNFARIVRMRQSVTIGLPRTIWTGKTCGKPPFLGADPSHSAMSQPHATPTGLLGVTRDSGERECSACGRRG